MTHFEVGGLKGRFGIDMCFENPSTAKKWWLVSNSLYAVCPHAC